MTILNHRDYRLAKARLAQIDRALSARGQISDLGEQLPVGAAATRRLTLQRERERLSDNVANYERLRHEGLGDEVGAQELGMVPILARIGRQLSQKDLAEKLGMKEQQVQRYERDKYASISLERYVRVLDALGVELLPRLSSEASPAAATAVFDTSLTPELLRELRKRNWVDLPRNMAPSEMGERLANYIVRQSGENPVRSLNRQTRSRRPTNDVTALWIARVLETASEARGHIKGKFNITDTAWLARLVTLSTYLDGPVRAARLLREHGIIFVYEPQLPTTLLDGAALMTDDGIPVAALTLRHDRIDNFWFTLLHELAHIYLHFGPALSKGFIDDDLDEPVVTELEHEADNFARTRLIADELWHSAPVRFTKSREAVERFARRLGVHPAIVAGRIREERDYTLFSDLIGSGQVRRLFTGYSA